MNNFVKTIAALALTTVSYTLFASFLLVYVEQDSALNFDYAAVKATGPSDGGYLTVNDNPYTGTSLVESDNTKRNFDEVQLLVDYTGENSYDYRSGDYNFCVELYDANMKLLGLSDVFNYDDIRKYIYTSGQSSGGADAWKVSSFYSVPEPSTGLLALFGFALLALSRRRLQFRGKLAAAAVCVAMAGGVEAAQNDPLLFFSTPGVDTYADGTKVKDGECYALVWTKSGKEFAGFQADGTAIDPTNNVVITINPLAEDGCCPETGFQIDAALAAKYADGEYQLCLLDTRGADGNVLGVDATGKVKAVNGYGLVKGASVKVTTGDIADMSGTDPAKTATESAVPADTPSPMIKNFRIQGDKAFITVARTVPFLKYNAARGATPDAVGKNAGDVRCAAPVQGDSSRDITIIVPVNSASGFYSIRRD